MNHRHPDEHDIRARSVFRESLFRNHRYLDRAFALLMVIQWASAIAAALVISPRTWSGDESYVHLHVWAAVLLGGVVTSLPVALALTMPGRALTRHIIAVAQMMFSALFIHLSGGRIETHFHIFGSLAFLAFYLDWKVLASATVVVALDHYLRGLFWPRSVYGVDVVSQWRWFEHAGWVLFEDCFLWFLCGSGRRCLMELAIQRSRLEAAKASVESEVRARTSELMEARAAAEDANRAKSEFLANMSHEIRTPMTAILGFTDLLTGDATTPEERVEHIRVIRRNGEHLLSIINDILDLSRIEAGRLNVELVPAEPLRIVEEVRSLMQVRAADAGIELRCEHVWPLPERVLTDPVRLRQILVNLVGNAIKFTERGSVTLRVRADRTEPPTLRFEVVDTGIGIPQEKLDCLFRPFSQVDSSRTRRFHGSGLGLAISKRLSEMLGGGICVSSTPGVGSTFTVWIAADLVPGSSWVDSTPLDRMMLEHPDAGDGAPRAEPCLEGIRVLLAEDGIDNQRLITHYLRKAGARITVVDNGRDAVAAALQANQGTSPFHVVLLDMQMPVMDGYAAAGLLRAKGYRRPVVAITAHAMATDRDRCIAAGCDDYLTKPIARRHLLDTCRRWSETAIVRDRGAGSHPAAV